MTLLAEKRKVGSSTLPLTTSSEALSGVGSRSGEPNGEPGKELRSRHDGQQGASQVVLSRRIWSQSQ